MIFNVSHGENFDQSNRMNDVFVTDVGDKMYCRQVLDVGGRSPT